MYEKVIVKEFLKLQDKGFMSQPFSCVTVKCRVYLTTS